MKLLAVLVFLLAVCVAQAAEEKEKKWENYLTPDPLMGDYKGTFEDGKPITATVIALGNGEYFAAFGQKFNSRQPPFFTLPGKMMGDEVAFESEHATATIAAGELTGREYQASGRNFKLKKVERPSPTAAAKPPAGARVLFDGSSLEGWVNLNTQDPIKWKLAEGVMEVVPKTASIESKEQFNDFRLHLEFRTPFGPAFRGQQRGNSGVYLQGRYEVQVLDSYALEGRDNECGGIYKVSQPIVNACAPPLQWQTYDIDFKAARFDEQGKKTENARVTIKHNGIIIHDDLELPDVTPGGKLGKETPEPGPLMLQEHGDPVQFRNIWIIHQSTANKEM